MSLLLLLLAACHPPQEPGPVLDDSDPRVEVEDTAPERVGSPCDDVVHPRVVIHELVSANVRGLLDADGEASDWVELANLDRDPVEIGGWTLSDGGPGWALPSSSLEPGALLLVFASGKDRRDGELHTDFSLDALGEPVVLADPEGCEVDRAEPGRLYRDVAYGRPAAHPEGWAWFLEPTPGAPNDSESRPGFAATPTLEPASGFYDGPITVTVASTEPGATLRVRSGGAPPGELGEVYGEPLAVDASAQPVVVRAQAFVDGLWPSRVATATYSQQPAILDDGLKVVSLVVAPSDLFDEQTGIYAYGPQDYTPGYPYFGANFWEDWERDLHVQVWEPDGSLVIDQDAGIKIHGGYTRAFEQKSFRLIARDAYGPETLDHRFFPEEAQDRFEVVVLEGAGDWCPTHTENAVVDVLFRDEDGVRYPTIDSQAWEPCAVYLNGVFWGLYAFREKLDEHYVAQHHDADPDNLDRIECTADGTDDWWRVSQGDWEAFDALNAFVVGRDFSRDEDYAALAAMVDLDNLATTVLAEGWWGNADWWDNNLRLWRERSDDGRWRWMTFDLGHSWPSQTYDHLGTSVRWRGKGLPIADALENDAFRVLLANQGAELLSTSLNAATALERLDRMHARIAPLIEAQYATWCGEPVSHWERDVEAARDFVQLRPQVLRAQLEEHLGLAGSAPLSLAADPPGAGSFQLTLVRVQPPATLDLFVGIPITVTALPAAGYTFAGWDDPGLGDEPTAVIELDGARSLTARFE